MTVFASLEKIPMQRIVYASMVFWTQKELKKGMRQAPGVVSEVKSEDYTI